MPWFGQTSPTVTLMTGYGDALSWTSALLMNYLEIVILLLLVIVIKVLSRRIIMIVVMPKKAMFKFEMEDYKKYNDIYKR